MQTKIIFFILVCFRADFDCFQVELAKNYGVNEWREDLRKVMMKAGLENNPTVFLFSDTQVMIGAISLRADTILIVRKQTGIH